MRKSNDGWSWTEQSLKEWRNVVDQRLRKVYAISIADAGIDDELLKSHWEEKESPFDFVQWFGNKYDLDPQSIFGV
ncbi:hypothetical protein JQ625_02780 [Bradyrhizobium diazoefficiens]|nr:hypothetical protein [Bradyrhizobium diazoefficiens]MBR0773746.1 hypothetical protein [Bradyrhizobium diazoefficiens]